MAIDNTETTIGSVRLSKGVPILTPLKAIRKKCLDCCLNQPREVALCPASKCPLQPYKLGKMPKPRPKLSTLKSIRAKCLDCSCFIAKEVRECGNTGCTLYPYRMGKNPNLKGRRKGNPEALRKWRENQKNISSSATFSDDEAMPMELVET